MACGYSWFGSQSCSYSGCPELLPPNQLSCFSSMKKLLYLTQRIPFPPNKGEKIRQYEVLKHLSLDYEVCLGTLVDDPADYQYVSNVKKLCQNLYAGTLDRRRAKLTCLSGLLTGEALSVTFYRHRGLAAWVSRIVRDTRPDAIVVCSSNMAPYVLDLPRPHSRLIVDLTDVDSEKWRAYAEIDKGPMRWVHQREWRRTAELEGRIAREADACLLVSRQEAALFVAHQPSASSRIHAVSNGVDHTYFDPALVTAIPYAAVPAFVFTGTMDYPPNIDAVSWFAREMLPLIRVKSPSAQFYIVGANPAPLVEALRRLPGVFVTGRVPDVRPYIAHATACVAPMRIARGIQNKVLEAMAMARPVIVTADALEGIDATPGTDLLLADTVADFAAACLKASGPEGAALGQAARNRVLRDYTWSERLRGLDPLLAAPA